MRQQRALRGEALEEIGPGLVEGRGALALELRRKGRIVHACPSELGEDRLRITAVDGQRTPHSANFGRRRGRAPRCDGMRAQALAAM